jgi:nucleotide-binding universal stress UspA family protein
VLSPGEHHQLVQHARRKLGSLIPTEALQRHITHEVVVVVSGDVAETIDQQARQFGAHVICLASHGQGAALSVLFGSVAQQVIAQSTRPVHVVRSRQ